MTLVFDGRAVAVPRAPDIVSFADDPKRVPHVTDGRRRGEPGRILVVHKTSGRDGDVRPGLLASVRDFVYARYQATTKRDVSWHATIDTDGSATQSADPCRWMCWHAGLHNGATDGLELVAGPAHEYYQVQLAALVEIAIAWTRETHTQRWIPTTQGRPIPALFPGEGLRHVTGVVGHRDLWRRNKLGKLVCDRGHGDPDDEPFEALERAGFRRVDFTRGEHVDLLRDAQRRAGLAGAEVDGRYGPVTRAALRRAFPAGQLVAMPGDA
jgi:hypothetical protein